jgi:hypothetical protein
MKRLLKIVDRWLFEEYRTRAEDLGIFRVLFAAYVLIGYLPKGLWIRELPQAAFSPPLSAAALFRDYPAYSLLWGMNAVTLVFACTLLLGWRTTLSSWAVALGSLLICTFCYADGKIDHDILVSLVPLLLAGSGWGQTFSLDARRGVGEDPASAERQPWLCALLALCVGLGFLTAGLAKARGGWLSPHTLATQWYLFPNFYVTGRAASSAEWAMQQLPRGAWKAMDIVTVIWETTFVLSVPRRAFFRLYCAVGVFFHFGVWQLFQITFGTNVLAYAAFVPWAELWQAAPQLLRAPRLRAATLRGLCAIPIAFGAIKLLLDPSLTERIAERVDALVLLLALPFGVGYVAVLAASAGRKLTGRWSLPRSS